MIFMHKFWSVNSTEDLMQKILSPNFLCQNNLSENFLGTKFQLKLSRISGVLKKSSRGCTLPLALEKNVSFDFKFYCEK